MTALARLHRYLRPHGRRWWGGGGGLFRGVAAMVCVAGVGALLVCLPGRVAAQGTDSPDLPTSFTQTVDSLAARFMKDSELPGLAIGVTRGGHDTVFVYGLADREAGAPVTSATLFEIGSISKTFTATAATWAEVHGKLRLTDTVADHLPEFKGTAFGRIILRNMATHTAGKFPFRLPPDINTYDELVPHLKKWKSPYPQGTKRKYATATIGMLGEVAAAALDTTYSAIVDDVLVPKMGLKQTFISVPAGQMAHYAQGYTTENAPRRIGPKILADEAYGVKSSAADMLQYLKIQMGDVPVETTLTEALRRTHLGYFDCGDFIQELIWERSPWPVSAEKLARGNGRQMVVKDNKTTAIATAVVANHGVLVGKTGSTKGFGTYVAYIPGKELGVVILANRYHSSKPRVELAHRLLAMLAAGE